MRVVSEPEFVDQLWATLFNGLYLTTHIAGVRAVTGPGRSGAIAAVYTSHLLHVPFLPFGAPFQAGLLIVDTAVQSGRTLRRALRRYPGALTLVVFKEPPRVKFWYEQPAGSDTPG